MVVTYKLYQDQSSDSKKIVELKIEENAPPSMGSYLYFPDGGQLGEGFQGRHKFLVVGVYLYYGDIYPKTSLPLPEGATCVCMAPGRAEVDALRVEEAFKV